MNVGLVDVVAAVIRSDGTVLVCQRNLQKRHGGLWEFPGGKVLEDESYEDALRREVFEELRVEASTGGEPLYSARDGDSPFVIHFIETSIVGTPFPVEHDAIQWMQISALPLISMAPADQEFVQNYLIDRVENIE